MNKQFIPNNWMNFITNQRKDVIVKVNESPIFKFVKPETLLKAITAFTIFTGANIIFNHENKSLVVKNTFLDTDFVKNEILKVESYLSNQKVGNIDSWVDAIYNITTSSCF